MNRGQLVQVAPPEDIYEKPNSRWIADFIGDVNLVEGRVVALDGDGATVETADGIRLRAGPVDVAAGATVWIAVRPEKIAIAPADRSAADALHGEVIEIGYRGDTSLYRVRLDNGLVLKASAANTRRSTKQTVGWNERVALTWAPESAMVLTR
jgi:putrescine transport system ATP-binding protein